MPTVFCVGLTNWIAVRAVAFRLIIFLMKIGLKCEKKNCIHLCVLVEYKCCNTCARCCMNLNSAWYLENLIPLNYGLLKAVNRDGELLWKVAFSWITTTDMCVFLTVSKSYLPAGAAGKGMTVVSSVDAVAACWRRLALFVYSALSVFVCPHSLASVIRGQVLTGDGTPLIGVNVSFLHYPEYGYTVTRQDGM